MPVKSLKVSFLADGADKVKYAIDQISGAADKFGKKNVKAKVGIDDATISPKLAELQKKLDLIAKKKAVATADVNDSAGKAKLITMSASLDKLSRVVANPNVSLRGADKALADIYRVDAAIDRLSKKSAHIKIDTSKLSMLSKLTSLAPNIGGIGASAGEGAASTGAETAGESGGSGGYLIGGAAALAATMLPALTPVVIGVGTALGGVLAAALVNKGFSATLSKQIPILEGILVKATQPVVSAVDAMLPQIDKFATSMGPELSAAFSASMPFLRMFVSVLEQASKILLPAFTQSMKEMTPYIPQLTQGFVTLTKGVAQLITIMGPEMHNSVIMFDGIMKAAQILLNAFGITIDILTGVIHLAAQEIQTIGRVVVDVFQGNFGGARTLIKKFGSDIADMFTTLRHTVATALDNMGFAAWGNQVANLFDTARHNVAQWAVDFANDMIHVGSDLHNWMIDVDRYLSTVSSDFATADHNVEIWALDIARFFVNASDDVRNWAVDVGRYFITVGGDFTALGQNISNWTGNVGHFFVNLKNDVTGTWSSMWTTIAGDTTRMLGGIANGIGAAFNTVKSLVESPINWVLTNVIDKADSAINTVFHLGLPTGLHLAAGGRINIGSGPTADDVPALVSRGETVVSAAHSNLLAPVFRAVGVPGYASGGIPVPGRAGALGAQPVSGPALGPLQGAADSLVKLLRTGAADAITAPLNALLGAIPGNGLGLTIAKSFGSLVVNAIKSIVEGQQAIAGIGPAGVGVSGGEIANGKQLYTYLLSNVFGGHKVAAAGAIASIWGESTWNPFAQGTGGRGLIGWTPPGSISNAAFSGGMATQLPAIVRFIGTSGDWGVIHEMEGATSILDAANLWGKGVERYGINDVHSEGLALAAQIMGVANPVTAAAPTPLIAKAERAAKMMATGGWINEPVSGFGLKSGQAYSFAEHGPEYVSPSGRVIHDGGSGGGDVYQITVQGVVTDPDGVATQIQQLLRDKKRHHGNQKLGLD